MGYATPTDLIARFGADEIEQLSDFAAVGVADYAVIDSALADASDEIDGYLATRYQLPLDSTPALLVRIACDIARYRLWKDRASEQVRKGYDDALLVLKRLSAGTMQLTLAAGSVTVSAAPDSRVSVFTADCFGLMP